MGRKQNSSAQRTGASLEAQRVAGEISWLRFCDIETFEKIAKEMGKTPQELNQAMVDFSEDERMAINMRFYEERIKKEEEDTGYTNRETGKPYKRKELNLPPLDAEAVKILKKIIKEMLFLGMRRLAFLPYYAAFVLRYIREKSPSEEERHRLASGFTVECQEAMHPVTRFVDLCQNNDSQSRNSLIREYRLWEHKLLETFSRHWSHLADKPAPLPAHSFGELALEQSQLLFRQMGQMAKIEAEHSSSGEFVSDLISVKADTAKKPAGTGPDAAPAKMKYDVFICHASEDKKDFVKPLADALIKEKLRVWYDEFELTLGDSLREKIDYGLANSEYGVVVLSEAFFRKKWPQDELDGLVARQNSEGKKVILPIWHKVSYDEVKRFSPTLAGKFAAKSEKGIKQVVDDILKVINYSGHTISTSDLVNKPVNQQYDQIVHEQAEEESAAEKPAGTKQVGRSEGENGRRNYIDELVRTVIKQRDILITAINEHPPESSERYEAVQRVSPRYKELPDMWGYAIKQASEIGQLSVLDPLIEDLQKAHKNLIGISGECEKMSGEFGSAIQNHSEATNRLIDYLPAVESASQALLRTSEEQAVTGQRIAPVEEQAKAEKKNKGSVKKALKVIGAIIGFLAALLTCIYLLWWLWTKFSA